MITFMISSCMDTRNYWQRGLDTKAHDQFVAVSFTVSVSFACVHLQVSSHKIDPLRRVEVDENMCTVRHLCLLLIAIKVKQTNLNERCEQGIYMRFIHIVK